MEWLLNPSTLISLAFISVIVFLSIYTKVFRILVTGIITALIVILVWIGYIQLISYLAQAPWIWNILSQTWWIVQITVTLMALVPLTLIMLLPGGFFYGLAIFQGLWWLQNQIHDVGDAPDLL